MPVVGTFTTACDLSRFNGRACPLYAFFCLQRLGSACNIVKALTQYVQFAPCTARYVYYSCVADTSTDSMSRCPFGAQPCPGDAIQAQGQRTSIDTMYVACVCPDFFAASVTLIPFRSPMMVNSTVLLLARNSWYLASTWPFWSWSYATHGPALSPLCPPCAVGLSSLHDHCHLKINHRRTPIISYIFFICRIQDVCFAPST